MSAKASPTITSVSPSVFSPSSVGIVELVLLEAKHLHSKTKAGDVYVRMKIGDGLFSWSKTNTSKNSSGIVSWNFVCAMKVKSRHNKVLCLRVNEASNFLTPDENLGECTVNLELLNPEERYDMCLPLQPSSVHHGNGNGNSNEITSVGELHFTLAYFPSGKFPVTGNRKEKAPEKFGLSSFMSPGNSRRADAPPTPTLTSSPPKSTEQVKAEQLYVRAMEEMGKFVQSAASTTANKPDIGDSSNGVSAAAYSSLKLASQLLLESLKIYRLGKSFAMLAFIFYQFDNLELTSKYLGYAEQIDPTFPVIPRLRKLLLESGCKRDPLDASSPNDRLSVIVVNAKNIRLQTPATLFCKLVVGYSEVHKETALTTCLEWVDEAENENSFVWKEFFEASLTKASERYHFGHQNLQISLYSQVDNVVTLLGECQPLDLFNLERDTICDLWLPLLSNIKQIMPDEEDESPQLRLIINYQMGHISEEDALSLLYNAVYCGDEVMVSSITSRFANLDLDRPFREASSSRTSPQTSDKLDPEYSTLLTKAARFGNTKMIKNILDLGGSLDAADIDGFTPIMRAVQFNAVYDNHRAIRYLHSLGANLEHRNKQNYDVYSYCQNTALRRFLQVGISKTMYMVNVEVCAACRFLHFYENESTSCIHCSSPLGNDNRKAWLISKREIDEVVKSHSSPLPPVIDHYLIQCSYCLSFGFPSTITAQGPQLTTASDTALIGTDDGGERTEFPLYIAKTMWDVVHHAEGCMVPSGCHFERVLLHREEVNSLSSMTSITPATETPEIAQAYFPLDVLPTEILQCVMAHLSGEDIGNWVNVCHAFREACDPQFWKFLTSRDFKLQDCLVNKADSWRDTYVFYHGLHHWITQLLLEEAFYPRYTIQMCEGGKAEVTLRLTGRKYLFNLDGRAFTFDDEFMLILVFSGIGNITSVQITAPAQTVAKTLELCALMPLPAGSSVTMAKIQRHESNNVVLKLSLEKSAVDRWIRPYLTGKMVPGFHSFLMLKDHVGGSVIMDLFYYTLQHVVLE